MAKGQQRRPGRNSALGKVVYTSHAQLASCTPCSPGSMSCRLPKRSEYVIAIPAAVAIAGLVCSTGTLSW
jgi:hypothetical protein